MASQNTTSQPNAFQRAGNGLIELSALATLIGTSSSQTLALGLKGAPGIPWAVMSSFGCLDIAKVNLAAAVPHRLREAFGLRVTMADSAVGLSFPVDVTKEWRSGVETASVRAVSVPVDLSKDGSARDPVAAFKETEEKVTVGYMFGIDGGTAKVLAVIPPTSLGDEIPVHFFWHGGVADKGSDVVRNDWLAIAATFTKMAEVFSLWYLGATAVWWVTAMPWLHGVLAATTLQVLRLGRDNPDIQQLDVLSGELPSALHPGGGGKIVLGIPAPLRHRSVWKIVWGTGALVNCVAVIATFLVQGKQPPKVSYLWIGFQVFWLLMRMVVFEVLPSGPVKQGPVVSQKWHLMTTQMRHRVIHLIFGLAKQQVTTHPRRAMFYQEDIFSATKLADLFQEAGWKLTDAMPISTTDVRIEAIAGDTLLRSCVWVKGIQVDNSDIYDSAIVFVRSEGKLYAIPSVRILGFSHPVEELKEKEESSLGTSWDPRGTSNEGTGVHWILWIPATKEDGNTGWLQVTGRRVLGEMNGREFTDLQLQDKLSSGTLNVSLIRVDDVKRVAKVARTSAQILKQVVEDAQLIK